MVFIAFCVLFSLSYWGAMCCMFSKSVVSVRVVCFNVYFFCLFLYVLVFIVGVFVFHLCPLVCVCMFLNEFVVRCFVMEFLFLFYFGIMYKYVSRFALVYMFICCGFFVVQCSVWVWVVLVVCCCGVTA